jgi:hypothetical protein
MTAMRHLSLPRILLLLEALAHLALARAALACLRYKVLERTISRSPAGWPNADETAAARQIGWAIGRVARVVPWRSDCLIQAAAARWMLRGRQIPSEIHIGVAKPASGFSAHAWVTSGDSFITGRAGHQNFNVIRIL